MDRLSEACRAFGLKISLDKTVVIFQPSPGTVYIEPFIYTDGKKLKVVDKFTCLGIIINCLCSLDNKIALRLKKQRALSMPWKIVVWLQSGLKKSTKFEVYNAYVLTCLLYSCETWVVYQRHLKHLERFRQRCLWSVLGIHWITHTPGTEVSEKANMIKIEAHIHRHRLRWVGHVVRLALMTTAFLSSYCMENYLFAPAHSVRLCQGLTNTVQNWRSRLGNGGMS